MVKEINTVKNNLLQMLDLPFAEILKKLPLKKNLHDGLADQSGPYGPYLRFTIAYEGKKNENVCAR